MLPVIIILHFLFGSSKPVQPVFQAQTIDSAVSIGYGLALGDVDGDGKPDILLADKKQFVWYRNGDWKKFVMIENLTEFDNVCIAARDINGDGKVEVAVGAQWNVGETSDADKSGSVHYLVRPKDPTQRWEAVELPHEPTIHRMKWAKSIGGKYYLVVAPLHGRGNKGGEGEGVQIKAYEFPDDVHGKWNIYTIEKNMHMTHNIDIVEESNKNSTGLYLAGKEGVRFIPANFNSNSDATGKTIPGVDSGSGEVRVGKLGADKMFLATIQPMHGTQLVIYLKDATSTKRIVIDPDLKEGHALAAADLLGAGSDQVVAGWRVPNKDGKVGVKVYVKSDAAGTTWVSYWIDENGMACEDLQVMDLNGDGKPDIIASGRATKNLKIYWNKS
ncbi:MAG: VCBS repeat-containing protein [Chitinophagaceae bacterium]